MAAFKGWKKSTAARCAVEVLFVASIFIVCVQAGDGFRHCIKVIDGDTIVLDGDETVRLLGIDTPELDHPNDSVRQFAQEAKDYVKSLVLDRNVRLEHEWERRDEYGRTLAYVFLPDGRLLNAEILKNGYGFVYTRKVYSRTEEFRGLERDAREAGIGLWGRPEFDEAEDVPLISWDEADKHYGENCEVQGTVIAARNTGRVCFLNFHEDWENHFTAVIFARDFDKFPTRPEKYYLNREVRVRGRIRKYRGKPEIICTSSGQITVVR
ncbi:MAG: thermonuclease family protein [Acidobacteriota bacterium]